jgi:chorismate mutase/prephenate dehydrogenase
MNALEPLRDRMLQLDAQLVELMAERTEVARRIGAIKRERNIPLRDFEVERRVLDHAARLAERRGLSPELARNVLGQLISESRSQQERSSFREYRGSLETVAVIGGAGRMGRWLCDFLSDQGHRVRSVDPADPQALPMEAALDGAGLAVIATPLDRVPAAIETLADLCYDGVVFDIASLKGHLKPAIAAAREAGMRVTSLHPMFGPRTQTLAEQVVCVCDCGDREATDRAAGFFRETAATLIELSLDEHDRIASFVLGLSHLANIVFTQVLRNGGYSFGRLNQIGSTTFHSQMKTTATVIQEDPELYYLIQRLNGFTPAMCELFERELKRIGDWIREDNRTAFVQAMTAGKDWLRA